MIPEIEKRIFQKIDFCNRFLKIRKKFTDDGLDTPIFKKQDIIIIFNQIGRPCKYVIGGSYSVERVHQNYLFKYNFIISKNTINIFMYIYIDGKFLEERENHTGFLLYEIPYDKNLLEHNYGLNSLNDLKNYIKDMIELCDEFVNEYCKEIDAGNVPE
ncbi:MAG TPA: hypothetical protein PLX60_01995 [Chitinophagales bacterium]|jgi:hypothetical protein|nr:hypothetical protein [Chitinophagales bacterium]HPH88133.1 hypothetical protein [Chitinophagales bacterium]